MFRNLKASEIDVRVSVIKENGFTILLYKDARCDMAILDETVGVMNWTREQKDNGVCRVSIYDDKKNMWIYKEDVGSPTDYEKEKGQASDSFKRACFNWGIGRELYTAPFIWINDREQKYIYRRNDGKLAVKGNFTVSKIEIENKKIIFLEIKDNENKIIFSTDTLKAITSDEKIDKLEERRKNGIKTIKEKYTKSTIEEKTRIMEEMTKILKKSNLKALENATLDQVKEIYKKIS